MTEFLITHDTDHHFAKAISPALPYERTKAGGIVMNIEDLSAHVQIQQVLYRYCRGVDRGDRALLASVYHEGAQDNHGTFKGSGAEFANWIIGLMDQNSKIGQHNITNMLIELDGDRAHVESYFFAYHPDVLPDGRSEGLAVVGGRYLDRFEKRTGCWKIADRRVILDFSGPPQPFPSWAGASSFIQGRRRADDASHGFIVGLEK